ncbi:MAG: type I glyceraldehyde-3-phosphate dehydrogenase [Candidatus Aenigmarchaeota archaeon]|nr:type I glyceraldehyde-3-phosphate dehydrogenase [Candidatus Aenigmarchaeota archaeon]
MRVAINGFGRIGRNFLKAALKYGKFDIVAINDLSNSKTLAHLFKYDSVFGKFNGKIDYDSENIIVDGKKIRILSKRNPKELPWRNLKVDLVLESTGVFRTYDSASLHLKAGAKRVVISAPPKNDRIKQIVMGVNEKTFKPKKDFIISNASCTTNCVAPVAKVLNDNFGVKYANLTTVHAYTANQNLLDGPHKDLRRARAAAVSMVPTTTGAAQALGEVVPDLKGKVTGAAIRVPIINGSIIDFVVNLKKRTSVNEVNKAFKKTANDKMKGIIEYTEEPLVSVDVIGNSHSAVFDSLLTNIEGDLLEVFAWYDNEWAYSCRLVDLINYIGNSS